MKVTILGSGSAYSDSRRFNSCYFVEASDERFLIDCGSDALRGLQKSGVGLSSIQKIFITHMHADHCGGLPAVLTAMHVCGRSEAIDVHVPFTQLNFVKLWLDNFFIFDGRMSFKFSLLPLTAGEIKLSENVKLEFIRTSHLAKYSDSAEAAGIEPVSFSVVVREGGKKFYFSSDLDSLDEAGEYIRGSVSLIEATHPSLGEIAALAEGQNSSLYFTHIPMELENGGEWREKLGSEFGIDKLNLVRDGQVLTI